MDMIIMRRKPEGAGDVGLRRVHRGEQAIVEGNAEYSVVLPDVDKVAIIALAAIELTAIATGSPVWSSELHFATIGAIAGLGGYSLAGRQRLNVETMRENAESERRRDASSGSSEGSDGKTQK